MKLIEEDFLKSYDFIDDDGTSVHQDLSLYRDEDDQDVINHILNCQEKAEQLELALTNTDSKDFGEFTNKMLVNLINKKQLEELLENYSICDCNLCEDSRKTLNEVLLFPCVNCCKFTNHRYGNSSEPCCMPCVKQILSEVEK